MQVLDVRIAQVEPVVLPPVLLSNRRQASFDRKLKERRGSTRATTPKQHIKIVPSVNALPTIDILKQPTQVIFRQGLIVEIDLPVEAAICSDAQAQPFGRFED